MKFINPKTNIISDAGDDIETVRKMLLLHFEKCKHLITTDFKVDRKHISKLVTNECKDFKYIPKGLYKKHDLIRQVCVCIGWEHPFAKPFRNIVVSSFDEFSGAIERGKGYYGCFYFVESETYFPLSLYTELQELLIQRYKLIPEWIIKDEVETNKTRIMEKEVKYTDLPIMPREEMQGKLLTIGATLNVWLMNGGMCNIHIETILQHPNTDDDLHKMIVYRFHGKHSERWYYGVNMLWEMLLHNGYENVVKELNLQ